MFVCTSLYALYIFFISTFVINKGFSTWRRWLLLNLCMDYVEFFVLWQNWCFVVQFCQPLYEQYSSKCVTLTCSCTFFMIWGVFARTLKSCLIYMPKYWYKAIDYIELVYEGKLVHFIKKVLSRIVMEDGRNRGENMAFKSLIGLEIL